MRNAFRSFVLLLLGLLASGMAGAAENDRFAWRTDLDQAREVAAADGRPLLLVFRCEP